MKNKKCKKNDYSCVYHACMSNHCQEKTVKQDGSDFGPGNCYKRKTYVLIISEHFPAYHSRKGDQTNFEEGIRTGLKKHTLRKNYELWRKRAIEVNSGMAVLSLRKWSGKPRRSKQIEIMQLTHFDVQKVSFIKAPVVFPYSFLIDSIKYISKSTIAKNDYLSENDFTEWFKNCPDELMALIHFTDFRY